MRILPHEIQSLASLVPYPFYRTQKGVVGYRETLTRRDVVEWHNTSGLQPEDFGFNSRHPDQAAPGKPVRIPEPFPLLIGYSLPHGEGFFPARFSWLNGLIVRRQH